VFELQIRSTSINFVLKGVVATVQHPQGVKNTTAWQRFLPFGPLALLPVLSLSSVSYLYSFFVCLFEEFDQ
jgi:2-polyprenyl-6-methoxyphenol hydroxylase-like FAD-dependent oxidoreductase